MLLFTKGHSIYSSAMRALAIGLWRGSSSRGIAVSGFTISERMPCR